MVVAFLGMQPTSARSLPDMTGVLGFLGVLLSVLAESSIGESIVIHECVNMTPRCEVYCSYCNGWDQMSCLSVLIEHMCHKPFRNHMDLHNSTNWCVWNNCVQQLHHLHRGHRRVSLDPVAQPNGGGHVPEDPRRLLPRLPHRGAERPPAGHRPRLGHDPHLPDPCHGGAGCAEDQEWRRELLRTEHRDISISPEIMISTRNNDMPPPIMLASICPCVNTQLQVF